LSDAETATARHVYASVERFFSLPAGSVGPATTAEDVATWDSVSHVGLILAVEEEFGVVFDVASVGDFRNLGELAAECSRLAGADFVPALPAAPQPSVAAPALADAAAPKGVFAKLKSLFRRARGACSESIRDHTIV
jgi:acyl carrier protein